MKIRQIGPQDNVELAELIRLTLREHKLDLPGTVYTDPTTDRLFELFREPKSLYWVAEEHGKILGGCGIFPTKGLPKGVVELVKLYLAKENRGTGLGKKLMLLTMDSARELGFTQIYLETFGSLEAAVKLYEKLDFRRLDGPLGDSGHFSCDVLMLKDL